MAAASLVLPCIRPVPGGNRYCGPRATRGRTAMVVASGTKTSQSDPQTSPSRRGLLLGGSTALIAPLVLTSNASAVEVKKMIPVEGLGTFQKKEMKDYMAKRALGVLEEMLAPEDAAGMMRLVLLDAGTYDIKNKNGGMNGSVILFDELSAEDRKSLGGAIEKLKAAKAEIDRKTEEFGNGQGLISWSDLLALAGSVAIKAKWKQEKIDRAETPEGGKIIAENFGTPFDVRIGRIDATGPDSGALVVPGKDSSTEEIKTWLNQLGNRKPGQGGYLDAKPPFWERPGYLIWTAGQLDPKAAEEYLAQDKVFAEFKKKYDFSKKTVTRTDFEVDFVTYYNRLVDFAAFDPFAYCFPLEMNLKV